MKRIKNLSLTFILLAIFTGCDSEEEAEVLQERDTAGVLIDISGSGSVLGVPQTPEDLDNSTVDFNVNALEMSVDKISGVESEIEKFEIVKQFNGGEEISMGEFESVPFTFSLSSLDEFTNQIGATADELRIGDIFTFTVKVHQTDGDVYQYSNQSFNLTVNCFADLSGSYKVTNSQCGEGSSGVIPLVNISQTPDGNWYLETADGGLLQYCTSNTALVNDGTISVVCGEVQPSSSLAFCPDYGIGCITGGTWDQENGILELELNDGFFGVGDYTATYVRQ
jgi:hypothetical protein